MTPNRKIIHIDMDAFYASVEQRDHPELMGRPVIVGGDPQGRGVVASASYEARRFGVRSAMSCAKAHRLCPQAVFVHPDISRYAEVSEGLQRIFHEITPLVEPLSLDEAYLDVTENLLGEPLAGKIAILIKKRIRDELGLTASAGVGPNKFIAKVASDLKKPDGLVVIPPEKVEEFVRDLPVEKIWGVGPATAKKLHSMGFFTAKDIRVVEVKELERLLGKYAVFLRGLAYGEDPRPVDPSFDPKSRSTETTFETDIMDVAYLREFVIQQAEVVAEELRELGRPGRTVTLKLRYSDFQTISRSKTLPFPTDDATTIAEVGTELLEQDTWVGQKPVRLIGLGVSNLIREDGPLQLCFNFPRGK